MDITSHPTARFSGATPGGPATTTRLSMEQLAPLETKSKEELVMIDPWPGVDAKAKDREKVTQLLELAHKDRGLHALMFFWTGWS